MTSALIIGRFQPIHKGHIWLIKHALKINNKITIVIGSAQEKRTMKNPFSVFERKKMIKYSLKYANISLKKVNIVSLKDEDSCEKWLNLLVKKSGSFNTYYTCDNLYLATELKKLGYKIYILKKRFKEMSSTSIREKIYKNLEYKKYIDPYSYDYIKRIKKKIISFFVQ